MIIRLANADDLEELRELVARYSEETAEHGTERNDALLLDLLRYGIQADEAVVVAEQFEEIVGWCAWVHLPASPAGKVEGLGTYVLPDYRQEHVSRDMRRFAEEHARRLGYRYVDGVAAEGNAAALESVLRMGFRRVGVLVRRDFDGQGNEEAEAG
jgi:GNAT superfamily N-acetyltransferase